MSGNMYVFFPRAFFAILHISLTYVLIYCRYKYIIIKLITLQLSHCRKSYYFSFYIVTYSLNWKVFLICHNEIYFSCHTKIFAQFAIFEKTDKDWFEPCCKVGVVLDWYEPKLNLRDKF
jgi:hypothetical protein